MKEAQQELNAREMCLTPDPIQDGMDVLILSTNSPSQQAYWAERLEATRGQIAPPDALIFVIHEDWPDGAGNGLGTLYAYQEACRLAAKQGVDLLQLQANGAAIGLYHTAGKGTRLAPLPGSEYNNKAAVKLPCLLEIDGAPEAMTMLEAIVRQTRVYGRSRKGRLSVFWGDQLFVPTTPLDYRPSCHVDILARMRTIPTEEEWRQEGLDRYGLICVDEQGEAQLAEKLSWEVFQEYIQEGTLRPGGGIGTSLGCFSLSLEMTRALLETFEEELSARKGSLGSDIHFWMPLTLPEAVVEKDLPPGHYLRLQEIKKRVLNENPSLKLLGPLDIGQNAYWWDYGQVQSYLENNLKLLRQDEEGALLRTLFGVGHSGDPNGKVLTDAHSCLIGCEVESGTVRNSLLVGVHAHHLDVEDSVIINTAVPSLDAQQALLYNVVEEGTLSARRGSVRADVFLPDNEHHFKLWTHSRRDSGKDWEERLFSNPVTYADLHRLNFHVNLGQAKRLAEKIRRRVFMGESGGGP